MDLQHYNRLHQFLSQGFLTNNTEPELLRKIQRQAKHFQLQNDLLYKIDKKKDMKIRVIQKGDEENAVLYMFHHDPTAAHSSIDKIMDKMKTRYYWPQMYESIRSYVRSCDQCQRRGKWKNNEPLHPIPVGKAFHQIGIDYVGPLPRTRNGNKYIIVAMDYLTK